MACQFSVVAGLAAPHFLLTRTPLSRRAGGPQRPPQPELPPSGDDTLSESLPAAPAAEPQQPPPPKPKTHYRGVTYEDRCKARPWRAQATWGPVTRHLGYYTSAEEAARACDDAARRDGRRDVNFPRAGSDEVLPQKHRDAAHVNVTGFLGVFIKRKGKYSATFIEKKQKCAFLRFPNSILPTAEGCAVVLMRRDAAC